MKSSGKSLAVLIKKAMAKIPATLDTKKSIDEYYKTVMKAINDKKKAEEKAKKAVAKGKTVKKPKKLVGGMTGGEELEIIDKIMDFFIVYNNKVSVYRDSVGDAKYKEGREYFLSDEYTTHI
jgi:hypothetical protein